MRHTKLVHTGYDSKSALYSKASAVLLFKSGDVSKEKSPANNGKEKAKWLRNQ